MIYTNEEIFVTVQDDHSVLTAQLMRLVPASWTSTDAKKRRGTFWALISGIGLMLAYIKGNIDQLKRQFRIQTATGTTLDVMAIDYFSSIKNLRLPRLLNETDNQYRQRIRAEILQLRTTKRGIRRVVNRVTGAQPVVLENLNVNTFSAWTGPTQDGKSVVALSGAGLPANTTFRSFLGAYGSTAVDQFQLSGNPPTLPDFASEVNNLSVSLTVLNGLQCWLKTDTLAALGYVGGTKINFWPNAAPGVSGFDAIALADIQRPTYRTAVNGVIDAVRFDNTDDQLVINADSGPDSRYTMFVVFQNRATLLAGSTKNVIIANSGAYAIGYSPTNGYQVDNNSGSNIMASGIKAIQFSTVMMTTVCIGRPGFAPGTSNASRMRVNGIDSGVNALFPQLSNVAIGGGAANPANADVFEFLLYNRVLTPTEILAVESYLSLRYILSQIWRVAPQPGIGALGGAQFGSPYNFFVFALQNPNAASAAAILSVIRRSKPIGTVEHLFLSK